LRQYAVSLGPSATLALETASEDELSACPAWALGALVASAGTVESVLACVSTEYESPAASWRDWPPRTLPWPPTLRGSGGRKDEAQNTSAPISTATIIASLAKSKKAELDLSERRGELVDRATLAAAVFGYLGKLNRILLESVESEIELYFDRSGSMTKQDLVKIRKELLTKHLTESATAIKSELRRGIIRAHKMAADDDD